MKRALLIVLAVVALHAPWRLWVLTARALAMQPGPLHDTLRDDRYWDARQVETRLIALNWAVGYKPNLAVYGQRAYGVTFTDEHEIWVDDKLHWNARLSVLAHEGGHTLQPAWRSRGQSEAFAECVAALVARDGYVEHARYLASLKMDLLYVVIFDAAAVYHAAAVLED